VQASARLVTLPFVLVTGAVFLGAVSPNLFVLASRYLAEHGHDAREIGTVMAAFMVGSLVMIPAVGRAVQRGRRAAILAAGCLVGALGCALFEWADTVPGYAGARVVQGMGFAAVLVSGSAYVAESAPPSQLAQALGFAGVLTLAAQAVAPAVGEYLVATVGWQWLFRAGIVAGIAGAAVGSFLPALPAPASSPDAARPPAPWGPIAAMSLAGFGFGSVFGFIAAYVHEVAIGPVFPFFWAYVAAAITTRLALGHLADRHGRWQTAAPALVGQTVALAALAAIGSPWHLVAIGTLFGLSHGIYYPSLQALIVDRAPPDGRSRAVATSNLAFGSGAFVATFSLGELAYRLGYPVVYVIAAGMALLASVVVWRDRRLLAE
jgi:MFS family permease